MPRLAFALLLALVVLLAGERAAHADPDSDGEADAGSGAGAPSEDASDAGPTDGQALAPEPASAGSGVPVPIPPPVEARVLGPVRAPSAAPSSAPPPDPPRRYFYHRYDYGSQSLYGPLYVILNRGFDVLQMRGEQRNLGQNFQLDGGNVWTNLTHAPQAINGTGGWWRFIRQEILPFSFTPDTARWVPNYTLHLIGGGQTYAQLREWFMDHEASPFAASAFSAATIFASAFVNESIENKGVIGYNTDCIADIMVFDVAGVVLFSFEGVRDFFSRHIIVSDWSMQPAIIPQTGNLHNQGNYYSAKIPIPWYPRLRLLGYGGMATMGGLSYLLDGGYSISAAMGGKFDTLVNTSPGRVENKVTTQLAGALFVDRNNSLLASLQVADVDDYFLNLNVYPNAIIHTDPGFGFWGVVGKDGRFLGGISFTRAFGLGLGAGTMK